MPYQMTWLVPRRVLLTTFSGTISQTELQDFVAEMRREFPKGEKPVYHISNSLAMGKVQLSLKALSDLVKASSLFSALGMQIDINHQRAFNTFLVTFATQIIKIETHFVRSMDEAVTLLKSIDVSLPPAPWDLSAGEPSIAETVIAAPKDLTNGISVPNKLL